MDGKIFRKQRGGREVKQPLHHQKLIRSFLFCLHTVFVVALSAQSSDDSAPGIRAPEPSEEFRLLSALKVDAHQADLYHEIKEKFNSSKLKKTHQDLLAKALSKVVSKVPISTFRTTTITEETGAEPKSLQNLSRCSITVLSRVRTGYQEFGLLI